MHIELVATDGKIQKRILWVDVTTNSVCSGYCMENMDYHITYHFDGNVFHNWFDGKPTKARTLPPLEKLKGKWQLYVTGFDCNLGRLHDTPLYRMQKLDAMVSVDTRAYRRGLGCMLFLVEPGKHGVLGELTEDLPHVAVTEVHSFLRCLPWVSLVLYGDVYSETEQK